MRLRTEVDVVWRLKDIGEVKGQRWVWYGGWNVCN